MLKEPAPGFVIAVLVVIAWALWKQPDPIQSFVMGQETAELQSAEQERLPNVTSPSSLPGNLHYETWRGNPDLSDVVPHPLDEAVSAFSQRFAASDPSTRSQIRDSLKTEDFYTLLVFSNRSAVFALRDHRREHVTEALTAVAVIDGRRIDFRDVLRALGLLHYAAKAAGEPVEDSFHKAASLAEPKMAELILSFLRRSDDLRDLKSLGYAVVQANGGPGFINSGSKSYRPTYPLDQIGLALGQLVRRDRYSTPFVTVAADLPAIWLSNVDDNALKHALDSLRGVVTIHAELRPQGSTDFTNNFSDTITIFLAELDDEAAAKSLFRLSQEKQTRPKNFALLAAHEGPLFCMVLARPAQLGAPPAETQASLQRFSTSIADILKKSYAK